MATEKTKTGATHSQESDRPTGGPDRPAGGRVLRGTVVASKMKDTITVAVERYVMHPKYRKFMRKTKKFLVHDAGNTAKEGEKVEIRETRPRSKRKHFELVKG